MKSLNKIAYPQSNSDNYVQPPHNIENWINSMRTIYMHVNQGMDFNQAFDLITNKWNKMDKQDFKNWMKFYQEGNHLAYKKADENFIPPNLRGMIPGIPSRNSYDDPDVVSNESVAQTAQQQKMEQQAREEAEKAEVAAQIKALIGRLNSAERIATTKGIDKVLGPVYESWMRALHDLKREIQVAPFRNVKSGLLEDLIIRKGNQLAAAGHNKSAKIMYKLAQVAPPPLEGADKPSAESAIPEATPASDPSNIPIPEDPNLSTIPDAPDFEAKKDDEWAEEFLKGLSGLVDEKNDIQDIEDKNATLEVTENDLAVYAQEAPTVPEAPAPAPIASGQNNPATSPLEAALSNVTIDQVIEKLQAVSNIFKNREVSRQLAMVDIMLDQLGLASYFPELSEATAKALESNQYCGTRVEDILGRLNGSIETPIEHAVDLNGEKPGAAEGNAVGLKNQLEQEKQKEDARSKAKEKAQNAQEDAMIANPQPEAAPVNTTELAQPTEVQPAKQPGVRV